MDTPKHGPLTRFMRWWNGDTLDTEINGAPYVPARDKARLRTALDRVHDYMQDGAWRSLREISDATNIPTPSVSAHLRSLRKPQFGGYTVDRKHIERGLWLYRVNP